MRFEPRPSTQIFQASKGLTPCEEWLMNLRIFKHGGYFRVLTSDYLTPANLFSKAAIALALTSGGAQPLLRSTSSLFGASPLHVEVLERLFELPGLTCDWTVDGELRCLGSSWKSLASQKHDASGNPKPVESVLTERSSTCCCSLFLFFCVQRK